MSKHLCIHGHFYQPPRVDPWLGEVLPEGSAAPALHWNERICRESYGPLAFARRLDGAGRIQDIFNAYEWISFNFGPTLLSWMERAEPATYARIIEGDRRSAERLGFGNAMAQVAHHAILPLASSLDKEVEVAWAVADFAARYGRSPDGMWLAEAAVDTESLEVLARHGVAFTVLAPRQAEAIRPLGGAPWQAVDEGSLDVMQPYLVHLPSGASISVFFYNGPLSQAVAFERLLTDGEAFWQRIRGALAPGLLSLATDGETYGHHFTFGEMALAYMLTRAQDSGEARLSNFAAFLAANPPRREARIREASSWSCVHGVERWRADCGCSTGDHPDWNQRWRAPLRSALDQLKARLDAHFFSRGQALFQDPRAALLAFGSVVAGSLERGEYASAHFAPRLAQNEAATAWKLLAMQRHALRSLASCAWFFDDLDRIEPINAMTYALRAMDLARDTGAPDLEPGFAEALEPARANREPRLSGKEVFLTKALPRRETPASLIAQALLTHWGRTGSLEGSAQAAWPRVTVQASLALGKKHLAQGQAEITHFPETLPERYAFRWQAALDQDPTHGTVVAAPMAKALDSAPGFDLETLPWNKRQALALAWAAGAEVRAWDEEARQAKVGLHFFQPLSESQTTQNQAWLWDRFWAPLAWACIQDPPRDPGQLAAVSAFIADRAPHHPEHQALSRRIADAAMAHIAATPPRFAQAEALLGRAQALRVSYDPWPIQNALWQSGVRRKEAKGLAEALGFAQE